MFRAADFQVTLEVYVLYRIDIIRVSASYVAHSRRVYHCDEILPTQVLHYAVSAKH